MNWLALGAGIINLTIRIWDVVKDRPRRKLESERARLEEESRQAQIDGDLDELRRIRGEIEEIDRKLSAIRT